jgi:hypothetical protein
MNRKQAICSVVAFLIAVHTLHSSTTVADDKVNNERHAVSKLVGTWKLEESENPGSPSGIGTRLKMFTRTHWCVVQPDPDSGMIVFQHGGTYEFDGSELKEKVEFAGESTSTLIGNTSMFKLEIKRGVLKQMDPHGVFNETWRKAKRSNDK